MGLTIALAELAWLLALPPLNPVTLSFSQTELLAHIRKTAFFLHLGLGLSLIGSPIADCQTGAEPKSPRPANPSLWPLVPLFKAALIFHFIIGLTTTITYPKMAMISPDDEHIHLFLIPALPLTGRSLTGP